MPLLVLLSKGLGIMPGVHPSIDIITYFNYLKLPFIFVLVFLQDIEKAGALIKGSEKYIMGYLKKNYCATVNIPDCTHIVETHHPQWLVGAFPFPFPFVFPFPFP